MGAPSPGLYCGQRFRIFHCYCPKETVSLLCRTWNTEQWTFFKEEEIWEISFHFTNFLVAVSGNGVYPGDRNSRGKKNFSEKQVKRAFGIQESLADAKPWRCVTRALHPPSSIRWWEITCKCQESLRLFAWDPLKTKAWVHFRCHGKYFQNYCAGSPWAYISDILFTYWLESLLCNSWIRTTGRSTSRIPDRWALDSDCSEPLWIGHLGSFLWDGMDQAVCEAADGCCCHRVIVTSTNRKVIIIGAFFFFHRTEQHAAS